MTGVSPAHLMGNVIGSVTSCSPYLIRATNIQLPSPTCFTPVSWSALGLGVASLLGARDSELTHEQPHR